VSASPRSRMPSAPAADSDAPLARPGDRWRLPGLVLLGTWSALFAVAIALWVRVAFLSGTGTDTGDGDADRGLVRLVGAPLVLVAVGLIWWAWWSARALRRGRREGWTLLLVLGGVSVAQAVLTAQAVLASSGSATAGTAASGPPREVVGGLLAVITLGLVTVVVAVLARRSWAAADPADSDDASTTDG
jgi:hypothetical protein